MVNSMGSEYWDECRDTRTTNESCWKEVDDNRLPNPPPVIVEEKDEVYSKRVNPITNKMKIIMEHELKENPESFQSIAQSIADCYNEAHTLKVGEKLPVVLKTELKENNNG